MERGSPVSVTDPSTKLERIPVVSQMSKGKACNIRIDLFEVIDYLPINLRFDIPHCKEHIDEILSVMLEEGYVRLEGIDLALSLDLFWDKLEFPDTLQACTYQQTQVGGLC